MPLEDLTRDGRQRLEHDRARRRLGQGSQRLRCLLAPLDAAEEAREDMKDPLLGFRGMLVEICLASRVVRCQVQKREPRRLTCRELMEDPSLQKRRQSEVARLFKVELRGETEEVESPARRARSANERAGGHG